MRAATRTATRTATRQSNDEEDGNRPAATRQSNDEEAAATQQSNEIGVLQSAEGETVLQYAKGERVPQSAKGEQWYAIGERQHARQHDNQMTRRMASGNTATRQSNDEEDGNRPAATRQSNAHCSRSSDLISRSANFFPVRARLNISSADRYDAMLCHKSLFSSTNGTATLSLLGGMTASMMDVVVLAAASSANRSGEHAVFFVTGEDDCLGDTPRLLLATPFIVMLK